MRVNQAGSLDKYKNPYERILADLNRVYPGKKYHVDWVKAMYYSADILWDKRSPRDMDCKDVEMILVLRYRYFYKHEAIARDMGIDISTVQRRLGVILKWISDTCEVKDG